MKLVDAIREDVRLKAELEQQQKELEQTMEKAKSLEQHVNQEIATYVNNMIGLVSTVAQAIVARHRNVTAEEAVEEGFKLSCAMQDRVTEFQEFFRGRAVVSEGAVKIREELRTEQVKLENTIINTREKLEALDTNPAPKQPKESTQHDPAEDQERLPEPDAEPPSAA